MTGLVLSIWIILTMLAPAIVRGTPILQVNPFHQSPVFAKPGEPLLLPGFGFSVGDVVVYRAIDKEGEILKCPEQIPKKSNATYGVANVISYADVPNSLMIRWPSVAIPNKTYAIWVRDKNGNWSTPIKVNDARPLWFSPSFSYETQRIGGLSRYIKVIGRNMRPSDGRRTRVRLVNVSSKKEIVLYAKKGGDSTTEIEEYVSEAILPGFLPRGKYEVWVSTSDKKWVRASHHYFNVYADLSWGKEISLTNYGCRPDDGLDDTLCIRHAIKDLSSDDVVDKGVVILGKGVWDIYDYNIKKDGIYIPKGMSIKGKGAHATTLLFHPSAGGQPKYPDSAWFTLAGENIVQGIRFKDSSVYYKPNGMSVIRISKRRGPQLADKSRSISRILIADNIFDRPMRAISNGGYPIDELIVTGNEFGAYYIAIDLDGYPVSKGPQFNLRDSVFRNNIFKPGSYMDVEIGQGTIAAQFGASQRVDFSGNHADGRSTEYLYLKDRDALGWRAAFFWHLRNNHEMLLVSQNSATCTGDKAGDGEAFAFDNNHNSFGFDSAKPVVSATRTTVKVVGPFRYFHEGRRLPPAFFMHHWVHVVAGPGVGQARKIVDYRQEGKNLIIDVEPAWDVQPTSESQISVGLQFWQLYVIDNHVDHRAPPCQKSNRRTYQNNPFGAGGIVLWAQASDSAIVDNEQFDTNGIVVNPFYSTPGSGCPKCPVGARFQYFIDIRLNTINGEYQWDSDCSWSGIAVSFGASPTRLSALPIISYGLSIVGNDIIKADAFSGGAISIAPSWWQGPENYSLPIIKNTIISNNRIFDISGSVADRSCRRGWTKRSSISLLSNKIGNTLLDSNKCVRTGAAYRIAQLRNTVITSSAVAESACLDKGVLLK